MSLEITTREFDRVIVVDVVGKLTTTEGRTQLRDLIHVFSETGHKRFLLNLAEVDYVDSSGMGELVGVTPRYLSSRIGNTWPV
jgi:anti-sigma B factor antagonist